MARTRRLRWWLHLVLLFPGAAAAQTDYRNLDSDRPTAVEDAYPLEHRAFEFGLPYHVSREGGRTLHATTPELTWGALDNLALGLKAPFGTSTLDGDRPGLSGLRLFALYNLFTEAPGRVALALRTDLHLPVGAQAGDGAGLAARLLATRSAGPWRVHVNTGFAFLRPGLEPLVEPFARWSAGVAVDRTLYRKSLLLIGELTAGAGHDHAAVRSAAPAPLVERPGAALRDPIGGDSFPPRHVEVEAGLGLRWQWTPTLVLDAGAHRRLTTEGHDFAVTLGLTHAFAFRPGRPRPAPPVVLAPPAAAPHSHPPDAATAPTTLVPPGVEQRNAHFYFPGRFNWQFLKRYPAAARLFNAFDYGHAVLYEKLLLSGGRAGDDLEAREFDFLVTDMLRKPPRFGIPEEAVAPAYARLAWHAKQVFEWAHILHRQIYDAYADERLSDSARVALVDRVTEDYLANRRLALATQPKDMALMDEQYYSQVFRQRYPKFNGLIWAYHWLQVGLYEPLVTGTTPTARRAGVEEALRRFWSMLEAPPTRMPLVMPMTAAIAPEFSRRHPRAAIIFDNLHALHDIISDILTSERVPASRKKAEIYAALARYQDPTRDVMTMDHWWMMGDMMGGVELMGGIAPGGEGD